MEPSFKSNLSEYISECKLRLNRILQDLNWTEASTLKDYHANYIASSCRPKREKSCCTLKSNFPESCDNKNFVVLETPELQALLENNNLKAPVNFIELQGNFSREQKLKLYEYALENTKKLENNLLDKEVEGEISLADILAQKKREEKKKKRRFRKSKPTHIEEVRCLVGLQMQSLEQFLENKIKNTEEATPQRKCSEPVDHIKEKSTEEKRLKEYGRKERHTEIYTQQEMKNVHRNFSREHAFHKRSSNQELTCTRKKEFKSRHRERRRSRSASDDVRLEREKHKSKIEHKSKEMPKHSTRSRSQRKHYTKEGNDRSNIRIRSYVNKSSQPRKSSSYEVETNSSHQKYSSQRKLSSYSKDAKEKYNRYYRNQSSSPERRKKERKS